MCNLEALLVADELTMLPSSCNVETGIVFEVMSHDSALAWYART